METRDAFGSLPESGEKERVSEPTCRGLQPVCPASPAHPGPEGLTSTCDCPKLPFQQMGSPEREVWGELVEGTGVPALSQATGPPSRAGQER